MTETFSAAPVVPGGAELDAVAPALAGRIGGAGQEGGGIERVDDLVAQPGREPGGIDAEALVLPAERRPPSRATFGRQRRIADERAGEEAVEIVEGRLGDALAISGVEAEPADRAHQQRGAQGRRIREGAEAVVAHGEVGDDGRAPLRPPLAGECGEAARPVLVGAAEIDRVAGVEILDLMLDGGGDPVPAELARQLRVERQPVAERAVQRRAVEPVAVGAVEIGGAGIEASSRPNAPSAQPRTAPIRFLVSSPVSARRKVTGIEAVILARPLDPVADDAEADARRSAAPRS